MSNLTQTAAVVIALAAGLTAAPGFGQDPPQQRPTFRAATDVVLIDAHVVARDGTPVQGLAPDQFEVFIDGRRRPVLSAEFVRAGDVPASAAGQPAPPGSLPTDGRVIVLGIDQASFPASAQASAREAATRVLDRVAAEDYLGMIAFPGPVAIAPTRYRGPIREGIARIAGIRVDPPRSRFNISAFEAAQLRSRETVATKEIVDRECQREFMNPTCRQEVIQDGSTIAQVLEQQAVQSITGIHGVLDAIAWPGRKTLMLVSAGLPMSRRPGSTSSLDAETERIARRAAAANVNLYVLYMNVHFMQYFSAAYGKRNYSIFNDIGMFATGLERFADSGGGTFFQIEVDSDPFVDRALRETSASYLVAVRAEPAERDGREHFIRVAVKARGATVRYRRVVVIPSASRPWALGSGLWGLRAVCS
jgi:VWFA-related protein